MCVCMCGYIRSRLCMCVRYTALQNTPSLSSFHNPRLDKVIRGF
uniref:Alternative protein AFF3 n=1 Tax=Homo sapiens TaxID=9606 RepID=L8E9Z7_HUMAN|nr:alternative protein AFF3 [Homo sapiens]